MGTTPPISVVEITDPINRVGYHRCQIDPFASLYLLYYVGILLWGAYLAYRNRDIWAKYNYPNESRAILLSIYNLGFCAIILIPLIFVLSVSQDVLFFLASAFILFPTSFALVMVYGPKVAKFLSSSRRSKRSKGNTASFPTGKRVSQNKTPPERGTDQKAKDKDPENDDRMDVLNETNNEGTEDQGDRGVERGPLRKIQSRGDSFMLSSSNLSVPERR